MKFSVNRSNLIRSVAVFFFCVLISACGAPKTLETLMSTESAGDKALEVKNSILSQNCEIYSDYAMEISSNDVVYKYFYTADFSDEDIEKIKKALEDETNWPDTITNIKDEIEQTSSIRPSSVTFIYYTSDKKELFKVRE